MRPHQDFVFELAEPLVAGELAVIDQESGNLVKYEPQPPPQSIGVALEDLPAGKVVMCADTGHLRRG